MAEGIEVVELEITLAWSEPPIWRKVRVPTSFTLRDVHHVIQCLFDWDDDHLHAFHFSHGRSVQSREEKQITIADLIASKTRRFEYLYDFGDSWTHEVRIVGRRYRVKTPQEALHLLDGENAAPPEDCGGIGGYYNLLEALADPSHPDHEWAQEWMEGEEIDPAFFDKKALRECLDEIMAAR